MSVVSVKAKSFILALFIRDDGERFLLGDNGYDFKDSQLHFAGNTIENDEVVKQGADGVILAGQVRRSAVQSFDGYVGDGTMLKETIEQMRRDFIAFFAKSHHFRVIYVDCNRNAWQRKGGYLVDAPEVKELWQIHPEYHVGLNFEDVNYYSYDEDSEGNEILANVIDVPVSTEVAGGLEWDEDGAVSEDATVIYDTEEETATPAKNVYITDATDAPLASFRLDGETSQNGTPTPSAPVPVQTVTGENVVNICRKNLLSNELRGTVSITGASIVFSGSFITINRTTGAVGYNIKTNTLTYAIASGQELAFSMSYKSGTINTNGTYTWRFGVYGIKADGTSERFGDIALPYNTTTPSASTTCTATSDYVGFALGCYLSNATNTTTGDVVFDCQLELGSTATAYEPYQGQSYEINLGKNLFDVSSITENTQATTSGVEDHEVTYSANNYRAIMLIKVEPNSKYTLSIGDTNIVSRIYCVGMKTTTLESGHSFSWVNSGTTITTTSKDNYILGVLNISSGQGTIANVTNANVQFEKGSQATSFAAYFTPIELCKIGDYQDYIYKSGGKWYLRKECGKLVVNGSETGWLISASTGSPNYYYARTNAKDGISVSKYAENYCNNLTNRGTYIQGTDVVNTDVFSLGSPSYSLRMLILGPRLSAMTTAALSTWLAANTPTIYYATATPTDTEITNEALVAQLETLLNTARTYAGVNNIFTVTPNEQGTLEISYYTKYQPIVTEGGYVWEAGGTGGTTTVVNDSIGSVNPIWKVYGPTTNPVLENITTGEQIEYIGTIGNGQTLTIDMGEQTASLDGLNVISNVIGDYISLASGANTLVYSVTGEAGASKLGWSEIVG